MRRIYYGWRIVAVAFFAQALTLGLTLIPFGLFVTPLVDEFGLSVARVQIGMGLFTLVMMGAGVGVGALLDRFSIRVIMAGGAFLLALSFLLMSLATQPWELAALFGIGSATGVAMTWSLSASTVIARWFDARRGLAMGVSAMGPPAGGLVLMPHGRLASRPVGLARSPAGIRLRRFLLGPLCFFVVRNRPEDVGQVVDGRAPEEAGLGA